MLRINCVKDAIKEKGCIEMNIGVDKEIPGRVVYISKWESKDDVNNHLGGLAFEKHIPIMTPYYISGQDTLLVEE